MARKIKSVYERINDTLQEIRNTEARLNELNTKLIELYEERDNMEMRQIWDTIKSNGLSIEDVNKLINNKSK